MTSNPTTLVTCQHFLSGIGQYSYQLGLHMRRLPGLQELKLFKPSRPGHPDQAYDRVDWIVPYGYRSLGSLHPYLLPAFCWGALLNHHSRGVHHAHWFLSGLACSYTRHPFAVTMHDVSLLHVQEKGGRYTDYYRWTIRRFRRLRTPLIVVSEQARQDTLRYAEYPAELVHVVHNGLDHDRFCPLRTTTEQPATEQFCIVYAGGLGGRKNLELLLRAFGRLQRRYPFISLRIAGAYPERTPYPALAQQLGLRHVQFTGFLPDEEMPAFYRSGDLMVYPSLYEGFGFAPLEAMASGTPVLCAKGGALLETAGGGARFFEYDEEELCLQMEALLENPKGRWQLRQQGLEHASRFRWEQAALKTSQILDLLR